MSSTFLNDSENAFSLFKETKNIKYFNTLFNAWFPQITYVAFSFVKDAELAKEIASGALLKLYDAIDNLENVITAKSFLYIVLKRDCLNAKKFVTRQRTQYLDPTDAKLDSLQGPGINDDFLGKVFEAEAISHLYSMIAQLPGQQKKVTGLLLENLSTEEIATTIETEIQTVRNTKTEAINSLKNIASGKYFTLNGLSEKEIKALSCFAKRGLNLTASRVEIGIEIGLAKSRALTTSDKRAIIGSMARVIKNLLALGYIEKKRYGDYNITELGKSEFQNYIATKKSILNR